MAPEERRKALVEATLPLLREHGANVSTRQIAEAAGVAEGTIFGVFSDKASLLQAAVIQAMDPSDTVAAIGAIDRGLPLRERLVAATAIIVERSMENAALMVQLHRAGVFASPVPPPGAAGRDTPGHGPPREIIEARERVIDAVVSLIGPDARRLRRTPAFTVNLLVSIVFVAARGGFSFMQTMAAPEEIVSVLLDGLLEPEPSALDARAHGGN
jgi:AcrR family transcriptional regulator